MCAFGRQTLRLVPQNRLTESARSGAAGPLLKFGAPNATRLWSVATKPAQAKFLGWRGGDLGHHWGASGAANVGAPKRGGKRLAEVGAPKRGGRHKG